MPNLATLIDRDHPGKLFTIIRLSGEFPETARLESAISSKARPVFVPLHGTSTGALNANSFLDRDIPVKLFPPDLGLAGVADALVYTGRRPDTIVPTYPHDAEYEAEKQRAAHSCHGRNGSCAVGEFLTILVLRGKTENSAPLSTHD